MKKIVISAIVAGLALVSVAAYAQMQHSPMHRGQMPQGSMQQGQMPHGQMQQGGMHHGSMHHGPMHHGAGQHGQHDAGAGHGLATPKGDRGPSSLAFHAINAKMHAGMDIVFTGNADVDFVRGMIPHHEGAVDMAKTVLAFGKDPEIRKLAEEIVKAQESEIAQMKAWLAKNAPAAR
jgi:pentapeptide MXKDX repeat protein